MDIAVVGDAGAFAERMRELGLRVHPFSWNAVGDLKPSDLAAAFFFPDGPDPLRDWHPLSIQQAEEIGALAAAGLGIYSECLVCPDWRMRDLIGTQQFIEPRVVWRERTCIVNTPGPFGDFAVGEVLDARNALYAIGRSSHQPILTVGVIGGTDASADASGQGTPQNTRFFHVLYRFGDGRRQTCANLDVRNAQRKGFLPRLRWRALIDRIIIDALPKPLATSVRPRLSPTTSTWVCPAIPGDARESRYRQALRDNVAWFETSGVLPAGDGRQGVYEGFDTYGRLMRGYRPECHTESALMLWHAADALGRPGLRTIARNILEFLLDSTMQDTTAGSASRGLWHFYLQSRPQSGVWYLDTSARTALGLLHFHRLTGEAVFLERARLTLEAIRSFQYPNGVLPDCADPGQRHAPGMPAEGTTLVQGERRHGTPHHHASVVAAFALAHEVTGDASYLETATRIQTALCAGFPDAYEDDFCWSFTIARYLLGLTALLKTRHRERFLAPTRAALEKLATLRQPSGAYLATRFGDMGYASFETGIVWSEEDRIIDNLYVTNYLGIVFGNLASVPEFADRARVLADEVLDFQTSIQGACRLSDQPHGAWTRAFNMRTGDPYAFNGDIGWGPYCVLTGWTNASIALGLIMRLQRMPHLTY